jgi:hypothetical protein
MLQAVHMQPVGEFNARGYPGKRTVSLTRTGTFRPMGGDGMAQTGGIYSLTPDRESPSPHGSCSGRGTYWRPDCQGI